LENELKIILASGNKGKLSEIKDNLLDFEIVPYFELIQKIDIDEDKNTFEGNAIKKAMCIYEKMKSMMNETDYILSDDSGISVDILNAEPGVHSARYANKNKNEPNASDSENVKFLLKNLKSKNTSSSPAFYTAVLVLVNYKGEYKCFDGYMKGKVINEIIGTNGFGYDPIFIPNGYKTTLGEMNFEQKQKISHRYKALEKLKEYLK
jgi:XTP/dITP diphosphohydrolase